MPRQGDPASGQLALLCGLFEPHVEAICAIGTFGDLRSLLQSPFLHAPHESIVAGAMATGNVLDLAASFDCPVHLGACIDGLNRSVSARSLTADWTPLPEGTRANTPAGGNLSVTDISNAADWLLGQLEAK